MLHELAIIAARFNQKYSQPKFDLDVALLVGPAVVSHFNKDVESADIYPVLQAYYDESELDEFETFLNQTPDLLRDDQDAGINWDAIYEPLNVVAAAVAAQRDQWSQGRPGLSDQYSPDSSGRDTIS